MKKEIVRYIAFLTLIFVILGCTACGNSTGDSTGASGQINEDGKLNIVTTIFPEYDWARNILGDEAENTSLELLLDSGVDIHNYQPSAEDVVKITSCDVFIYVGGESDRWVTDALKTKVNSDLKIINLMDVLQDEIREEELKENMQSDEEPGAENNSSDESAYAGYDEHVWLSLKNASIACKAITDALSQVNPDKSETYQKNCDAYISEIESLDADYKTAVDNAKVKTLLFGDRFPFRYLVDDYGLNYYAAFSGCSAESEASFETIRFLSGKVDELGIPGVITLDGSNQSIAKTIISNTKNKNAEILTLNSFQSVTQKEINAGETYISVMKKNLEILKKALGYD